MMLMPVLFAASITRLWTPIIKAVSRSQGILEKIRREAVKIRVQKDIHTFQGDAIIKVDTDG